MKTYGKDKLTIEQMHSNPSDAKEAGHVHYFTGKPCIHGHISTRHTASRRCFQCLKNFYRSESFKESRQRYWIKNKEELSKKHYEWLEVNKEKENQKAREIYKDNREYHIDRSKKYYHKNREAIMEKKRKYRAANKEKIREQNRAYYLKKKKKEKEEL